jgi:hypothetical protein
MEINTVDNNMRKLSVYPWPEDGSYPKQFITFADDSIEISEKAENNFTILRSYKHYLWEIMLILNKIDSTVGMIPVRPIMEDNILELFSNQMKLNLLVNYPWKSKMLIEEIIWTIDDIIENPLILNIENYDPRKKMRDLRQNKESRDFDPDFSSGTNGQESF